MLVVFGGLAGSGKRYVAREFARQCGFHLISIDEKKMRLILRSNREYGANEVPIGSVSEQMSIYKKVTEEFPQLSASHSRVALCAAFHRATSREYILEEALKYFLDVRFIWIDSNDESMRLRMMAAGRTAYIKQTLDQKRWQEGELEPKAGALIVTYTDSVSDTVSAIKRSLLID